MTVRRQNSHNSGLSTKPTGNPFKKNGLEFRAVRLVGRGAYAASLPLLRRALLRPQSKHNPELRFALARSLFQLGDIQAALRELQRVAQSRDAESRRAALGKIAVAAPGAPKLNNAQILKARRQWAELERRAELRQSTSTGPLRESSISARRKVRLGYVSAFFAERNWMKPIWGTLQAHDRRRFEIHLFIERGLPKSCHGYVPHKSDRVHVLDHLSNEQAANLVAKAKIDILVDLNAYSYPGRFGLFLRKPAPIQLGLFANFATTGVAAFNYAVADHATLPPGEERFCSERILRVVGSYLAFAVPYRVPKIVSPPCLRSRRITFGCLAPQYKITPDVIAVFARILRLVPSSRLFLKNTCFREKGNRTFVRASFQRHGVSSKRLICEGPAEHFDFLKAYAHIDIAVDTFPYSGGTTTMEALWQGVPVLTFPGDRWVSRTTSSLLQAAGLQDWIVPSRRAFIKRAVALAKSPYTRAQLSLLRATMRDRLRGSAACDVIGLCRQLENHYLAMIKATRKHR
jgi:protein O-GlcNAc transferase